VAIRLCRCEGALEWSFGSNTPSGQECVCRASLQDGGAAVPMIRKCGKTFAAGGPVIHVTGGRLSAPFRTGFSQIHARAATTIPSFLLLAIYLVAITWGYMLEKKK